jgi:hypothetical protein
MKRCLTDKCTSGKNQQFLLSMLSEDVKKFETQMQDKRQVFPTEKISPKSMYRGKNMKI